MIHNNVKRNHFHWGLHLMTLPISSYLTQGAGKVCGFETLRHGTTFPRYFSILRQGADPKRGGQGSSKIKESYVENSKNYFHVFKDCEARAFNSKLAGQLFKQTMPRLHAVLTGTYEVKKQRVITKVTLKVFWGLANFFCPTVRFMYRHQEIPNIFKNDYDYGSAAYKTKHPLSNNRIGLGGLLKQVKVKDIKREVQKRPLRVLTGIVEMLAGTLLTGCGLGIIL